MKLNETSNYPWDGKIKIKIAPAAETKFVLKLRIPAWSHGNTKAKVNGKAFNTKNNMAKGYLVIDRTWNTGDVVTLDIPMPARRIYANPAVKADVGKVALARGPLVYCVEQVDNAKTPVSNLFWPQKAKVTAEKNKNSWAALLC